MSCPFALVPSARTALLYFLWYGSFLKYGVRFASWPWSPSVRASVNGTSNTVGSVPAASLAAKVGPVHWYSTGLILIVGYFFSNSATWALNCLIAACVLPGMSEATLILTVFADRVEPAAVPAPTPSTTAATTIIATRVGFIVSPFHDLCDAETCEWIRC